MSKFSSFLSGMVVGAALLGGAMSFHFVHSSKGLLMVRKLDKGLDDTYIDIRQFGPSDWQQHPRLASALLKSDRAELIGESSLARVRDGFGTMLGGLVGTSSDQPLPIR